STKEHLLSFYAAFLVNITKKAVSFRSPSRDLEESCYKKVSFFENVTRVYKGNNYSLFLHKNAGE
ncbi:MAG: hypothetical protein IIX36_08815, partial [Clostridia bacterium]|nr:hypothetical protein [Clostridia bacterium]